MKLFSYGKDGGPESTVTGFWLIEIRSLFSIALLRFKHGSRDSYHSHAFNCVSWLLKGNLKEYNLDSSKRLYKPSIKPIVTKRSTFHKVYSAGTSWVLTFRGPWSKTWKEYNPVTNTYITLSYGRKIIENRR